MMCFILCCALEFFMHAQDTTVCSGHEWNTYKNTLAKERCNTCYWSKTEEGSLYAVQTMYFASRHTTVSFVAMSLNELKLKRLRIIAYHACHLSVFVAV